MHTSGERSGTDPDRPVTLINSFVVPEDHDSAFLELWEQTSAFFRAQPGFHGLRLLRAIGDDATARYVNVADWNGHAHFAAAHASPIFAGLVRDPGWARFTPGPRLYRAVTVRGPIESA